MKKNTSLVNMLLHAPLRSLALTVEEVARGEFRWRILESHHQPVEDVANSTLVFKSVRCANVTFMAYDSALASGYGELQRMVGPDLEYGPRKDLDLRPLLIKQPAEARTPTHLDMGGLAA